ncbi:MAG: peptidoglycan D,D-transpeptidase FtsI family protein [Alphaproteobacteria bacterium]
MNKPNEDYKDIAEIAEEYKKKKNFNPSAVERTRTRLGVVAGIFGLCFLGVSAAAYWRMMPADKDFTVVLDEIKVDVSEAIDEANEKLLVKNNEDFMAQFLEDLDLTGENTLNITNESSFRADILDRNGIVLATSLPTTNLYIRSTPFFDKTLNLDIEEVIQDFKVVFEDFDEATFRERMSQPKRLVPIRKQLTPSELKMIYALGMPAIELEQSYRRFYPQKNLMAHPVGMAGRDGNGLTGLEFSMDKEIRGQKQPVELSLDVRIQQIMTDRLYEQMEKFSAKSAAGVLLDIHTGEILSMVSMPTYDPNDNSTYQGEARRNLATQVWEQGSTMKLVNAAIALESGLVDVDEPFDARVPIRIGRFKIDDYHGQYRKMKMPDIIIHSSNIGSAHMALKFGRDYQMEYMRRLGFLERPILELKEHGRPLYPSKANWRKTELMTMSYGHGIAVSPLQTVHAYATMANGGWNYDMSLKKRSMLDTIPGQRIFSEDTSRKLRGLMRLVVLYGSGRKADAKGYRVGGKTGTADKVVKGGYSEKKVRSSFAGVFPIDEPKYAMVVTFDEPQGIKESYGYATAGWVAAPTFKEIIEDIAPIMGLVPKWDVEPKDMNPDVDTTLVKYVNNMPVIDDNARADYQNNYAITTQFVANLDTGMNLEEVLNEVN